MSCPDLLVLSQLADAELPAAESAALVAHLATCADCGRRVRRLEDAGAALARAADAGLSAIEARIADGIAPAQGADCLTPTELAAWLARDAGEVGHERRTLHVETCSPCLEEAIAASRTMRRLSSQPLAVPEALKARVASRWPIAEPESVLTSLVIRVTRAGARFLERTLVSPIAAIADLAAPAPAFRAEGDAPGLRFQLQAAEARISATVEPVGEAVSLTLILEGANRRVLSDQRVFLRRHGRSIYSARTDAAGAVRMPDLERGVYEVSFPAIATAFRLDLRA